MKPKRPKTLLEIRTAERSFGTPSGSVSRHGETHGGTTVIGWKERNTMPCDGVLDFGHRSAVCVGSGGNEENMVGLGQEPGKVEKGIFFGCSYVWVLRAQEV